MELAILKTIAAFLNMSGGTLIIGVTDDGNPVGIETDKFPNEDKMYLHLVNLIKDRMGPSSMMYIHPRFDDYQNVRVMVVDCTPGKSPVFLKDGPIERFFVRTGAATTELTASQMHDFIKQRFVT
jgi:predicted HTH transcriptional regulator